MFTIIERIELMHYSKSVGFIHTILIFTEFSSLNSDVSWYTNNYSNLCFIICKEEVYCILMVLIGVRLFIYLFYFRAVKTWRLFYVRMLEKRNRFARIRSILLECCYHIWIDSESFWKIIPTTNAQTSP